MPLDYLNQLEAYAKALDFEATYDDSELEGKHLVSFTFPTATRETVEEFVNQVNLHSRIWKAKLTEISLGSVIELYLVTVRERWLTDGEE